MSNRKILQVHFSPTGTTRKTVETIAGEFEGGKAVLDLLRHPIEGETACGPDDLVVVGMPVYAGRIPNVCAESLAKLKGNNTPALAVVVYGNRAYDDALLELRDALEANGFAVIGAAAFVAQHSIFPATGWGRPDAKDLALMADFGRQCAAKLESFDPRARTHLEVRGNSPYRQAGNVPLKPSGNFRCNACGACVAICPTRAIAKETPKQTDPERCISCAACIAACPRKARNFRGLKYWLAGRMFGKKFSARREPEFFVG